MPSKSAIQKKLECNRTFRIERKTENLREQLASLHQNSQELHEELTDRNNTILLLRECEEELLQGLDLLEI